MTENSGITKNDLYAYLTRVGVRKGYDVISEFVLLLPKSKIRKLDLVWAERRGNRQGNQDAENPDYWRLKAIFEIEGCNIRALPSEFNRHAEAFKYIRAKYGKSVKRYVVLYTEAFDRRWAHNKITRAREVKERIRWGGRGVRVVDGNRIKSILRDPGK
jgi:hypothetical protein